MYILRKYQSAVQSELYEGWNIAQPRLSKFRRQMVFLPTGGGKTILFNHIVDDIRKTTGTWQLILAHRKELVKQAATKFQKGYGTMPDIIMPGFDRLYHSPVKVGSVQTISSRIKADSKKKLYLYKTPRLVVFDEGHHTTAKSWKAVSDHFPESLILMVTATPCKMDGSGFEDICDNLVLGPSVMELEQMWKLSEAKDRGLVPDRYLNIRLSEKVRKVKKTRGDFDTKEVNKILNTDAACNAIVDAWLDLGERRKTIAFCSKKSRGSDEGMNDRLARLFNERGIPAACIHGNTPAVQRDKIIADFAAGKYLVLTNVEIFTEGFDLPGIDCTIMARPTLSVGLYIQMGGRGKRPNGQEKMDHLVMDFVGNVPHHGPLNEERQWSLKGVKREKNTTTLIKYKDRLMQPKDFYDQVKEPGRIQYEVVHMTEPYRVRYFDQFLAAGMVRHNGQRRLAGWVALNQFLQKIKFRPSAIELQYICDALRYKDSWWRIQYAKLKAVTDILDNSQDPAQLLGLLETIDRKFTWQKNGKTHHNPGHKELKAEAIKRASQLTAPADLQQT